jgi:hypothetical protein
MGKKRSQKPDPPKSGESATRKCKGPGKCESQCLVDDVQEWYYSTNEKCQMEKKDEKGVPPALAF